MKEVAYASWEVWEGRGGLGTRTTPLPPSEWELGKVWAEKKEIFYEQGQWRPSDNITYVLQSLFASKLTILYRTDGRLDFDAMDSFMTHIIDVVSTNGTVAVRVFPPESMVILSFADKIALEVVRFTIICEFLSQC